MLYSLAPNRAWQAVLARDRTFDGTFVYAVTSTGIYCRPSCAARRPLQARVRLFASWTLAEAAGFRACRRCRPHSDDLSAIEQRIEQAKRYLETKRSRSESLDLRLV